MYTCHVQLARDRARPARRPRAPRRGGWTTGARATHNAQRERERPSSAACAGRVVGTQSRSGGPALGPRMAVYSPSPLWLAAARGDVELTRQLLLGGADPNANTDSISPLWTAAESGCAGLSMGPFNVQGPASGRYAAVVQALLEHEADVNWQDPHSGSTALHAAVKNRNEQATRLLVQHPDIHLDTVLRDDDAGDDQDELTALHEAAQAAEYGNTTVVQLLLEAGANASIRAPVGTAHDLALLRHNWEAAEMIRVAQDMPLYRARQRLAFTIGCLETTNGRSAAAHNRSMAYDLLLMTMQSAALRLRVCPVEVARRIDVETPRHLSGCWRLEVSSYLGYGRWVLGSILVAGVSMALGLLQIADPLG